MFTINVSIKGSGRPVITALALITSDKRDLLTVLGRATGNELQQHFQRLDRKYRNRMGAARSHFWLKVRDSVQLPRLSGSDNITVTINHPVFPHKAGYGENQGHIYPKNHKWLTIPAVKDAYDRSAKEWENENGKKLLFFKKNDATAFLAEVRFFDKPRPAGSTKWGVVKAKEIVRIVFVLKKHVYQPPMADALPTIMRWENILGKTATEYVNMIIDLQE